MSTLFLILFCIFAGVALMVVIGERFGSAADPEKMQRYHRWLVPLVGLMLVLSVLQFYLRN